MMKNKSMLLLMIILPLILSTGCMQQPLESITEEPPQADSIISNGTGSGSIDGEIDAEEHIPTHEYTDDEKVLLSIATEKIIFSQLGWIDGELLSDLDALKKKYPDLELRDTYYNKNTISHLPREGQKSEYWYSVITGFTYQVEHFYYGPDEIPATVMHFMSGQANALITGLIAPIEIYALMEALGIQESALPMGKAMDSLRVSSYANKDIFYLYDDNSVFIVMPEPGNENLPISITITTSKSGAISPTDKLLIEPVYLSPE